MLPLSKIKRMMVISQMGNQRMLLVHRNNNSKINYKTISKLSKTKENSLNQTKMQSKLQNRSNNLLNNRKYRSHKLLYRSQKSNHQRVQKYST